MRDRRRTGAFVVLAVLMGLWAGLSAAHAATPEDLDAIDRDLRGLEEQLERMRGRYINPLIISEERRFDHRFERAQFLYRYGDYVHAAILFSDLMEFPGAEARPEFYDLLWFFGDSLAHNGNYMSARIYLDRVVKSGSSGRHFGKAVVRLIQISVEQQRFEEAESYYAMMSRDAGAPGWDMIQYAYAKSLHKQGQLDRALRTFQQINPQSSRMPYATYFMGAILVEQGRIGEALDVFTALFNELSQEPDEELKTLRELTTLAIARVLFEQGNYNEALSLYRTTSVNSPYFDQAYYEVAWIHIQREQYAEASNTLDILLLAMPDSVYSPDSQVLKGNINLLEGRFDEARTSFQLVINRYAGVVDTLDDLLSRSEGKSAESIQQMLFGENTTLPPVALAWLSLEEDVAAALALSASLDKGTQDTEESHRIIASLRMHLTQESKAKLFPALREGREQAEQVESGLTEVRRRLVNMEARVVGDRIPEAERSEMHSLQRRRRDMEMVYDRVPKTTEERRAQRERQLATMERMERDVHQLTLQIKGMEEMVATIMSRHERARGDARMSQRFLAQVEAEVTEIRALIAEMNRELRALQQQVALGAERVKIGDDTRAADGRVRQGLEAAMAAEKVFMERLRNRLGQEELQTFDRLEAYKRRADRLESNVEVFFHDLESLVAARVEDFMAQVEREEALLLGYSGQLTLLRSETEELAATIAYQNVQVVRDRFYALYLKANVGLIDIAWERRQRVRDRIDVLLEQRAEEHRQLNESFEGVRQ